MTLYPSAFHPFDNPRLTCYSLPRYRYAARSITEVRLMYTLYLTGEALAYLDLFAPHAPLALYDKYYALFTAAQAALIAYQYDHRPIFAPSTPF